MRRSPDRWDKDIGKIIGRVLLMTVPDGKTFLKSTLHHELENPPRQTIADSQLLDVALRATST